MKKTALLALTALTSLLSISAHAASEIRCEYKLQNEWQMIVIDYQMPHKKAKAAVPFMWHTGDEKFGTTDIQFITAANKQNHLKNWTYVKAYSDIVDSTFDLDIQNGKISIEQNGKYILKNGSLSCKFNQGGE